MKYLSIIFLMFLIFISGCSKDNNPVSPTQTKDSNFSSPDEYVQNPSIKNAVQNSNININRGTNPPPLVGDYNARGDVKDASSSIKQAVIGLKMNSLITLYNQTTSGKINFREKVGGLTAWATGGYVTGDNGKFTIWQESKQSGAEAGLPNDISINIALLMSGQKLNNGDLQAEGISIVTKVETNNSSYDTQKIIGVWWMWDADFYLQGAPSASKIDAKMINGLHQTNNKIMSHLLVTH